MGMAWFEQYLVFSRLKKKEKVQNGMLRKNTKRRLDWFKGDKRVEIEERIKRERKREVYIYEKGDIDKN